MSERVGHGHTLEVSVLLSFPSPLTQKNWADWLFWVQGDFFAPPIPSNTYSHLSYKTNERCLFPSFLPFPFLLPSFCHTKHSLTIPLNNFAHSGITGFCHSFLTPNQHKAMAVYILDNLEFCFDKTLSNARIQLL